jgi:hypothetical protein
MAELRADAAIAAAASLAQLERDLEADHPAVTGSEVLLHGVPFAAAWLPWDCSIALPPPLLASELAAHHGTSE